MHHINRRDRDVPVAVAGVAGSAVKLQAVKQQLQAAQLQAGFADLLTPAQTRTRAAAAPTTFFEEPC